MKKVYVIAGLCISILGLITLTDVAVASNPSSLVNEITELMKLVTATAKDVASGQLGQGVYYIVMFKFLVRPIFDIVGGCILLGIFIYLWFNVFDKVFGIEQIEVPGASVQYMRKFTFNSEEAACAAGVAFTFIAGVLIVSGFAVIFGFK